MERCSDLVGTADLDGRILFVIPAVQELLALEGHDDTRILMSHLVPPRYESTVREQILPTVLRDGRWEGEIPFRHFLTNQSTLVLWTVFLITEPATKHPNSFGWVARVCTPHYQVKETLRERERDLRRLVHQRKRLFEDLHDNIIQMLYAGGMRLEECRRLNKEGLRQIGIHLEAVIKILNDAIRDVRSYFVLDVEPDPMSGEALVVELQHLADAIGEAHLIAFVLNIDATAAHTLTAAQASNVLAFSREAISNSLRHGAATRVTIALRGAERHVLVQIEDDGIGFDMETELGRGRGLTNMGTRAERLGATLEIASRRGSGTIVSLVLPKEPARGVTR